MSDTAILSLAALAWVLAAAFAWAVVRVGSRGDR